jgi:hypothetical protein
VLPSWCSVVLASHAEGGGLWGRGAGVVCVFVCVFVFVVLNKESSPSSKLVEVLVIMLVFVGRYQRRANEVLVVLDVAVLCVER